MTRTINVGIIGYGFAAKVFHIPFIQAVPGYRINTIVEQNRDAWDRQAFPDADFTDAVEVLLADDEIELMVVTTPNESHYDLCRRGLENGKNVIVEKPFTIQYADALALVDLADRTKRLLSVHHNRRWDGDFMTVKRIIDEGMLGRLVEYESHFDRFRNTVWEHFWRDQSRRGSGTLYDLGSHLIDQALTLFGPPRSVWADVRVLRQGAKVDDSFEVILGYPALKVTLKGTLLSREPGLRFLLHGTEGSYVKYGLDPQEDALKRGERPKDDTWGRDPRERWGDISTQFQGLHLDGKIETITGDYRQYYRNIYDCLTDEGSRAVTALEAARVIRIIELAFQSSEEGRVIPIEW